MNKVAPSKHDWTKFDDELDMVLETVNSRTVEKKLQAMTTIVVAMGQERFGTVEKLKKQQPYKENRRARGKTNSTGTEGAHKELQTG